MLSYLIAQSFGVAYACCIFLGGDDALGGRKVGKDLVDAAYVFFCEGVMIGKTERREVWGVGREVFYELAG